MPFLKKRKKKVDHCADCNLSNCNRKEKIDRNVRCFTTKDVGYKMTYDGNCKNGLRDGFGSIRRLESSGYYARVYIGQWKHDKKNGEGQKFYSNAIYFGMWRDNLKHGIGILWYNNGNVYLGEWEYDRYNGAGVLIHTNKNRYEGMFKNGKKHGEGTYYHLQTGQIQKGMWEDGQCKTSIMQDELRNRSEWPTEYPIQRNRLADINHVIHDAFRRYMANIGEFCSCCSLEVLSCDQLAILLKHNNQPICKNIH